MKKVVAYCGFNFTTNCAYLRMPQAFSGQTDAQQLEIVNQLIAELTKEQQHLLQHGTSSPDTSQLHQLPADPTFPRDGS
jgi:hypothetical protein